MDDTILSLDELKSRITSYYREKKAADMPSETDPQETTPPTPVKDDGDDADLLVVPDQSLSVQNSNGEAENNIPGMSSGEASGKEPGTTETTDVTADKTKQKEDEAVSDPVTAKVAADGLSLAERIKSRLMGANKSASEEVEVSEEAVAEAAEAADSVEEAVEAVEEASDPTEKSAEQVASDFDVSPDAYKKIASLVLGYQEGREMLDRLADKEMGKQAAQQLIAEAEQLGAQEAQQQQGELQKQAYINNLASQASQDDVKQMQKFAAVHVKATDTLQYDFEKMAYDAGAEAAAGAMDEGDGMIPGEAGGDVSPEEIAEVVMAMVESGELDPAVAEAILAELAGAAGGAGGMPPGMEGGMPPGMEGGMPPGMEGMPPEAMMEQQAKVAFYNTHVDKDTDESITKVASQLDSLFTKKG